MKSKLKWLMPGLIIGFILTLNINYGEIYDFSLDQKWAIYNDNAHMITVPNKNYEKGDFMITISTEIIDDVNYSFKLK